MPVLWWMELDIVSLEGNAMSSGVFWCFCGLGMALGSLSANEHVCLPVLLKIWSEISSTGASCPLSGAWPLC